MVKNVLVTGSSGFLGKTLVKELIQLNINVIGYDIIDGYDILNSEQLSNVLLNKHIDVVIHLAAIADLNIFKMNIELANKINVLGTSNVLALCNNFGIRLLFASTCCCYGNTTKHPSLEGDDIFPTEPYAESKAISEKHILETGLPHTIMRLATFYGANMRGELAPAIFLDRAHNNRTIDIHGKGLQQRTLTYITDIVSGIIAILLAEPTYTIVNITGSEIISVLDMVTLAKNICNSTSDIKFIEDRMGQIYKEDISNDRLRSLGWKPLISFDKGMKLSYQFYIENNGWTALF